MWSVGARVPRLARHSNDKETKSQAAKLHREHVQIRREERALASRRNGHITKAEQAAVNHQENRISRADRRVIR